MDQFLEFRETYHSELSAIWQMHANLGNQAKPFRMGGFCNVCGSSTPYNVHPRPASSGAMSYTVRWAGLRCQCGLSATERRVITLLLEISPERTYHVGHYSDLAKWLVRERASVVTSQFKEGFNSGYIDDDGVRYESLTGLSFDHASFDCIVCLEVLEHIPNYLDALSEMHRCLADGGRALLTFPWLGGNNYEHRERAKLLSDGSIEHLLPPSYHGDPASEEGILCFNDFGWKILDDLREAGFSDARAVFLYSPIHGFMTLAEPVIVATK